MTALRRFFTPPVFESDIKTRKAHLLFVILWGLILVPIPYVLYHLIAAPEHLIRALLQTALGETVNLILLYLLRRGHIQTASIFQVSLFWLFFTASALTSDGVRGAAYLLGYPLVIVIAGVLLGGEAGYDRYLLLTGIRWTHGVYGSAWLVCHTAMERLRGQLDPKGAEINLQPNLPAVHGDRARLVQVMQNLIDNAVKYANPLTVPCIEIGATEADGHQPIFFVRDNGLGLDPQFHERIFGLFNKLDIHTEGTGIGLTLVKRIIEAHGGKIWVESAPGHGATFYFTLPEMPQT